MNDEYLKIDSRVFVKTDSGIKEIKDEGELPTKLKLENLNESLLYHILSIYSNHIYELQTSLANKKRRLNQATRESSKKVRKRIITACAFAPVIGLVSMIFPAGLAGLIDKWYDIITLIISDSTTQIGSAAITGILLFGIYTLFGKDYSYAKREVRVLEEEIPSLEQEIYDRQKEKDFFEEHSKRLETTTVETPELQSLHDYNQKLMDQMNARFKMIEDLEEAKKTLTDFLQSAELDSILDDMGFTKEEAMSTKRELEKRFSMHPKCGTQSCRE